MPHPENECVRVNKSLRHAPHKHHVTPRSKLWREWRLSRVESVRRENEREREIEIESECE